MKTIRITCTGAGYAALEKLNPLQSGLKNLSERNYQKLKATISGKHGFSFPFAVWKNKDKLWTVDGHQRLATLLRLKEEGYKVPALPVDYIEAKNVKEAKEKILLATSQYGMMNEESLEEFTRINEIDLESLAKSIELPQINIEELLAEVKVFGSAPTSVKKNIDKLQLIAARKKENIQLSEKRDTEKFLILVFESREQKSSLLMHLGLPSDERYILADALLIRHRGPKSGLIKSKFGRPIKEAPIKKAGATG